MPLRALQEKVFRAEEVRDDDDHDTGRARGDCWALRTTLLLWAEKYLFVHWYLDFEPSFDQRMGLIEREGEARGILQGPHPSAVSHGSKTRDR